MKRTLILLAAFLMIASGATAQEQKNQTKAKKFYERIQAEKVAFFTSELDLSPEEAQVFWPVYNQFCKESQEAHCKTMKLFSETMPKNETISESEMEKRLDNYVKALDEEKDILGKYHKRFKKVLPIEKVAKLYKAEEAFRLKMIRGLKSHRKPDAEMHQKAR